MIPITTPKGTFNVWTKRVGNNPTVKLLLLHGGPGMTHEYFESADAYLPAGGVEYYYYDQLGSFNSDQPKDSSLWNTERFVEEVEQVRLALRLNDTNFYLLGQSWGGILALEYALKYQEHLRALVISNMMASIPAYNEYAEKVLMPGMDPAVLAEIKRLEAAGETDAQRRGVRRRRHHVGGHGRRDTVDHHLSRCGVGVEHQDHQGIVARPEDEVGDSCGLADGHRGVRHHGRVPVVPDAEHPERSSELAGGAHVLAEETVEGAPVRRARRAVRPGRADSRRPVLEGAREGFGDGAAHQLDGLSLPLAECLGLARIERDDADGPP